MARFSNEDTGMKRPVGCERCSAKLLGKRGLESPARRSNAAAPWIHGGVATPTVLELVLACDNGVRLHDGLSGPTSPPLMRGFEVAAEAWRMDAASEDWEEERGLKAACLGEPPAALPNNEDLGEAVAPAPEQGLAKEAAEAAARRPSCPPRASKLRDSPRPPAHRRLAVIAVGDEAAGARGAGLAGWATTPAEKGHEEAKAVYPVGAASRNGVLLSGSSAEARNCSAPPPPGQSIRDSEAMGAPPARGDPRAGEVAKSSVCESPGSSCVGEVPDFCREGE